MSDTNAGRLVLDVVASLSGFKRDLQAKVDAETKDVKASVGIKLDETNLRRTVEDAVRRASLGIAATIGVKLDDLNSVDLRTQLRAALANASRGIAIVVPVHIDSARLRAEVDEAVRKAQAGQKINIPVDAKGGGAGGSKGGGNSGGGLSGSALLGILKGATIIGGAGIALGAITALTGGIIALGAAVGPAFGALAAGPGIMASLGIAEGTTKLAFSGLGTAMKAVTAQQDAAKAKAMGLTAAQYAQVKAISQLTATQKQFGTYLLSLQPQLTTLKQTAANNMLPGLEIGMKAAMPLFPIVKGAVADMGNTLGDLGTRAGQALAGLGPQLSTISNMANVVIGNLGLAAIQGGSALIQITAAAKPLTDWMTGQIAVGARWIEQWVQTGVQSGKLNAFFDRTKQVLTELGHILENTGKMLFGVFKAATPLGNGLLQSLVKLTAEGARWANSFSGQSKMVSFFNSLRAPLHEIDLLIGAILKDIVQLGVGAQGHLAPLIAQIRTQLLPAIDSILKVLVNNGSNFAPQLINALSQIAKLFADFTAAGGGMAGTAHAIADIAQALDWLVRNVPGFSTLLTAFLAFVAARRFLSPMIGQFKALGTALKGAQSVGYSLFRGLAGTAQSQGTLIERIANRIGLAVSRMWSRIAASNAMAAFRTQLSLLGTAIAGLASAAWASITSAAAALGTQLQLLGRTMITPPVGIILLIAAIGVALYELYKHSTGFRDFVNAIARVIKTIFVDAFHIMERVVMDVISFFKKNWPLLLVIISGPIGIIADLIYRNWNSIKSFFVTIFHFIENLFSTVWNAIRDAFVAVWNAIRTAVTTVINFVRNIIVDYWNFIKQFWLTIWNAIKTAFTAVWDAIKTVITTQINIIKSVITDALKIISSVWNATWGAIKSVAEGIWNGLRTGISTLFGWIESAFHTAVGFIGSIWNGIKDVVEAPVKFVVNTVYDDGIRPVVNTIASWVGIHNALPSVHLASGGAPHIGPGQVGTGVSAVDDTPAVYRRGEHVLTPEEVHGLGGHGAVAQLRSAALGGRPVSMGPGKGYARDGGIPHFLFGGIVGDIEHPSRIYNAVGRGIVDLARDGAAAVVATTVGPLVDGLVAMADQFGNWGHNVGSGMHTLYEQFYNWVKGKDESHVTSDPGPGDEVTRWTNVVTDVLRLSGLPTDDTLVSGILSLIRSESSGNPNAINLTDSNAAKGTPSQGLMQTIPSTFAAFAGKYASRGITDPFANIYAGVHYAIQNYGIGMLRAGGRHTSGGGYEGYALGGTVDPIPGGHIVRIGEAGYKETITDTASLNQGFQRLETMLMRGGAGMQINTTINNPTAEPASESLNSRLRRLQSLRLLPA